MTAGNPSPAPLPGSKRAALRLALVSLRDRRWILSRLSQEQRQALEDELAPLLVLGPDLLASVRGEIEPLLAAEDESSAMQVIAPTPPEAGSRETSELERASVDELEAVLRELPWACAGLLAKRMPPSRRHVLDAIEQRAGAVAAASTKPAVSTAFVEALVDTVEQRLEQRRTAGLGLPQG
ncbi:MAG TPA: hypothetical protein VFA75_00490 [Nevskia sp.]|nr:hypothetical protein [Nevskia sp.]